MNAVTTNSLTQAAGQSKDENSLILPRIPSMPEATSRHERVLQAALAALPFNYQVQLEAARQNAIRVDLTEFSEQILLFDSSLGIPQQWVTLTRSLLDSIAHSSDRSASNLFNTAFAQREEHLTTLSTDSLNTFNARYFESRGAFAALPRLYTENSVVGRAFAKHLDQALPQNAARIREVCAGEGSLNRWGYFFTQSEKSRQIDLSLCDSSVRHESRGVRTGFKNARATIEHLDLLDPLERLAPDARYDCIVCCYGFDSVWFPSDSYVIKHAGLWHEALFRVAVPDWHPARDQIVDAFQRGDASHLDARLFDPLLIERSARWYEPSYDEVAGQAVVNRLSHWQNGAIPVPRGLVAWVTSAFERQLHPHGRVLIGDAGCYKENYATIQPLLDPGCPAKAMPIEFELAEIMLRERGYSVTVTKLEDFVAAASGHNWRDDADYADAHAVEQPHQFVMEITRQGA